MVSEIYRKRKRWGIFLPFTAQPKPRCHSYWIDLGFQELVGGLVGVTDLGQGVESHSISDHTAAAQWDEES